MLCREQGQQATVIGGEPRIERAAPILAPPPLAAGLTTLDRLVERYELPLPNHLRFGEDTDVTSVLAAATTILKTSRLKTIFVTVPEDQCDTLTTALDSFDWVVGMHKPISRGRAHVVALPERT